MKNYFYIIIICSLSVYCKRNHQQTNSNIELESMNNNDSIQENLRGNEEYFYKVRIVSPDSGLMQIYTEDFLKSFTHIKSQKSIKLIKELQKKAIKKKEHNSSPPFLQFYIKNELTFGKNIFFYIALTEQNNYIIYYFKGGFKSSYISKKEVNSLIEFLTNDSVIEYKKIIMKRTR